MPGGAPLSPLQLAGANQVAKAVRQTYRTAPVPAPSKGLDAISNLSQMDPASAIYLYNLNPTQFGCRVRPGYINWCSNVAGTGGVRTLIPVRGQTSLKQFGCSVLGITDVTNSGSSPTQVVTFPTQTGNAGYGKFTTVVDTSGDLWVLYCDEVNGLYYYQASTNTWMKATSGAGAQQISGADPATFVDVIFYAGRVMFVQSGTGLGWYIQTAGALWGTVASQNFGANFAHGGNLNSFWSYTFESVYYLLEYLVTISDAGDVVLYQGTDITNSADWTLHGKWYIGDLPAGRRMACPYGGDLLILSQFGAIAISNLISGVDITNPGSFITEKIAPALVPLIQASASQFCWGIILWPAENALLITTPLLSSATPQQFLYNQLTKAWAIYQGIPMQCAANWDGVFYSGTSDQRVLQNTGTQDNVGLSGADTAISFVALGAFSSLDAPGIQKQIDLIRPNFVADQPVSYVVVAQFDYDITEPTGTVPGIAGSSSGWDSSQWDNPVWGGAGLESQVGMQGGSGMGTSVAIGIVGSSVGNSTLVGYECSVHAGGFL